MRAEIAEEITRIHTEATGAPRSFVNVVFQELPAGRIFTAGAPAPTSVIGGTIRAGRDSEVKRGMLTELSAMWERITGRSQRELLVGLTDIEADQAMEAGLLFPQPGEEAQWFEDNRERLEELGVV